MSRNQLRPYAAHRPIPEKTRCVRLLRRYSRARDIVSEHVRMDREGELRELAGARN
jgi:hypothetical protein